MAEEKTVKIAGGDVEDGGDDFYDATQTASLSRKVSSLEWEKGELERENRETKEKIGLLTKEVEALKSGESALKQKLREVELEVERNNEGKNVLESVANRAMELETEVSRLQQDLITAMAEAEEANTELAEMKRVVVEKGERIDGLEKEIEALKKKKTESEKRVRELERNIGVLEVKEIEERSKRVRVEEEMRERLESKEGEVILFKRKIEELESVIGKNGIELQKWMKEKSNVELALRESEDKSKAMELKMGQLQKDVVEAGRVINEFKEKTVGNINGTVNEMKEILEGGNDTGSKGLSLPVVAGSAGAIVAVAAVVFVLYGRRR
ncbi:peroxisomal and mitochondrial division factor 2-like [Argentina anserina]|uniref:peroxisomal and mitochondrial division factor 2-like n=1 Tax=Argentina anserina TaxID=57926 RepID=UPI0021765DBD|nr:peroxisomal and mitochondrial division factor 2-like [Potentilla anserina]